MSGRQAGRPRPLNEDRGLLPGDGPPRTSGGRHVRPLNEDRGLLPGDGSDDVPEPSTATARSTKTGDCSPVMGGQGGRGWQSQGRSTKTGDCSPVMATPAETPPADPQSLNEDRGLLPGDGSRQAAEPWSDPTLNEDRGLLPGDGPNSS